MDNNEVWVYENNDWIKGEVIEQLNDSIKLKINDDLFIYYNYEICNNIENIEEKNNLVDIPNLNEPEILNAVHKRYNKDIIYTYTGKILIAVNPFKNLNLFSKEIINKYKLNSLSEPHIYQITDKAYNNLLETNINQTILVSGESGAGKTYSVRNILKYLTSLSKKSTDIENKVVESNPILEAFGNAKTIRNENSSRFGKFIKVQIKNRSTHGCKIDTYLLEKIRVINQNNDERNFHIFYQLLSSNRRDCYNLSGFDDYNYLNNKYIDCKTFNDKDEFELTLKAFKIMGFSNEIVNKILKIIASILHLGNITFTKDSEIVKDKNYKNFIEMLEIDPKIFINGMCYRKLKTVGEIIDIKVEYDECIKNRNSLAMKLYSSLFDFIVKKINGSLKSDCDTYIGVLDIFGFESFKHNSFEQFCINYTNERLQEQFNEYMFKLEQKEYENEGVDWTNISFPDNKECLSLIESKKGIIKMLDEECKLPRGNDKNFTSKLLKKYKDNNYIKTNKKFFDSRFIINHYAGEVEYISTGFCEKNKDTTSDSIKNIINSVDIINDNSVTTSKINTKTVAIQFKQQLCDLMEEISKTSSQYIRCIKPNDLNVCNKFNRIRVNQQIKYSGILAAIKVSRAGYPIRFKKEYFEKRYNLLNTNILENTNSDHYAIGITKIFLKNIVYDQLENKRNKIIIDKIVLIQCNVRCFLVKKKYDNILTKINKIQCIFRMFIAKQKLLRLKKIKSSIIIQKNYRRYINLHKYNFLKKKIILCQSIIRKYCSKQYVKKIKLKLKMVIKIQKFYRKIKKKRILNKINEDKRNWAKMVEKWNELEEKTIISDVINNMIQTIVTNFYNEEIIHKQKIYERVERERKKKHKLEELEIKKKKNEIDMMKKKLEKDNEILTKSINERIKEKRIYASEIEKLFLENMYMKKKINSMNKNKSNCTIS
jgi:myosin V